MGRDGVGESESRSVGESERGRVRACEGGGEKGGGLSVEGESEARQGEEGGRDEVRISNVE